MSEASELIEALRRQNPQAVELAKAVSLATRVEPRLLREVRVRLMPQAGADAEADLWFSPLVESRSPVGLVLAREVAEELRAELLNDRALLEASWQIIRRAHAGAHPTIRLEERIARLALAGEDDESTKPAALEIEERMHEALAGLASEDAVGVARWAVRALPRMSRQLTETGTAGTVAAAEALALGAGAHLDGRRVLETEKPSREAVEKLRWVLPPEETAEVGVRLLDNGIELSQPPTRGEHVHAIKVHKTNPLVFDLLTVVRLPPPIDSSIPGIDPLTGEPFSDFEQLGPDLSRSSFSERVRQSRRGGRPFSNEPVLTEHVERVSLPLGTTQVVAVDTTNLRIRTTRGDTYALRPASVKKPQDDYWFYLSYSVAERREQETLQQFYGQLTEEVRVFGNIEAEVPSTQIGFFDMDAVPPVVEEFSATAEAINRSRAFVCLLSPNYIRDETKGREFQLFLTRLEQYAATHNVARPPLILPVVWRSEMRHANVPRVLKEIQWFYAGEMLGVADLHRQERAQEYHDLVRSLAETLAENVREHRIPPLQPLPPLREVKNAFESPAEPEMQHTGPTSAVFIYIVASASEMKRLAPAFKSKGMPPVLKKDTWNYGEDLASAGEWWRPFMPESGEPVLRLTTNVTHSLKLQHETLSTADQSFEKMLARHVRDAAASNKIVVIMIDPWALLVPRYRQMLNSLSNIPLTNCAVLLLWNEKDEDLARGQARRLLESEVKRTISGLKFGGTSDLVDVRSASELEKVLADTLNRLRARLLRNIHDAQSSSEGPRAS